MRGLGLRVRARAALDRLRERLPGAAPAGGRGALTVASGDAGARPPAALAEWLEWLPARDAVEAAGEAVTHQIVAGTSRWPTAELNGATAKLMEALRERFPDATIAGPVDFGQGAEFVVVPAHERERIDPTGALSPEGLAHAVVLEQGAMDGFLTGGDGADVHADPSELEQRESLARSAERWAMILARRELGEVEAEPALSKFARCWAPAQQAEMGHQVAELLEREGRS